MRKSSRITFAAICTLGFTIGAFAGNKDRVGQSGASELLINPWARTTGVFGLNTSYVGGMEAMKTNVGGLAQDSTLEIGLSHAVYLTNTGINVNNLAVAQTLGNGNVIGLNIMSMNFGDIVATDYNNPDGYGLYHPQFLNIELGFARQFSTHVNAGAAATYVNEQVNNINAQGLAFEGGIQYVTGKRDNFHLGVTLRNLGTNMRFSGTGFAINGEQTQSSPTYAVTQYTPSEKFEMPTTLNMGVAYDFFLDEGHLPSANSVSKHKLTVMGNFTSNSFINDYLGAGAEYSYKNMFMLRAAYRWENGIGNPATSTTMFVGVAAGATVQSRMGTYGPMLAFDYSYRPTQRPANGVHMFTLRLTRGNGRKDEAPQGE